MTAETFGIANKAKKALKIKWSAGPMDQLSDAQIDDALNGIIDQITSPGEGVEGTFRWPYVPHAPMEENTSVRRLQGREVRGLGRRPGADHAPAPDRRDPRHPGGERHLPRDPGRWGLRPSPVPRPGRAWWPRSPSGSASRSSCSGCGKRASSTAVPARCRSTR